MRSIAVIALVDGGAAAAAKYHERVALPLPSWWQPPEEVALKRVCQDMRAHERYADALEICGLNAELHPYEWSPWYNLGAAQRSAGRNWQKWLKSDESARGATLGAAGLASYRCIETVDPLKFEDEGFRALLDKLDAEHTIKAPASCPKR
jgi:hypothetical protein